MDPIRFARGELRRSLRGPAWHGPALLEALGDVTAEEAMARPLPGVHSIAELAAHSLAWIEEVERRLRVGTAADPARGDWPPVEGEGSTPWGEVRSLLERAGSSLDDVLASFPPERLLEEVFRSSGESPTGVDRTYAALLHGLAQHNAYHGGQVSLLKAALRRDRGGLQATGARHPRRGGRSAFMMPGEAELQPGRSRPSSGPSGGEEHHPHSGHTPMNKVTPFLMFNDQLEAAIEFYTATFPNSEVRNVARTGEDGPISSAEFVVGGQPFMGYNGGPYFSFSEGISLYVDCADQAEVDEYWDRLVEAGATPTQCGWIRDPFGLSWQIVPRRFTELIRDRDARKVKAVMEAMMTMVKLDVAELERAYAEA